MYARTRGTTKTLKIIRRSCPKRPPSRSNTGQAQQDWNQIPPSPNNSVILMSPRRPGLPQHRQNWSEKPRTTRRPREPRRRATAEPRDTLARLARRRVCEVCVPAGKKKFARPRALSLHMGRPIRLYRDLLCTVLSTLNPADTLRAEM